MSKIAFQGQVKIDGINDKDLNMILEYKITHPQLQFNAAMLQSMTQAGAPEQLYSNCVFSWNNEEGMKHAYSAIHKLLHGHDADPWK